MPPSPKWIKHNRQIRAAEKALGMTHDDHAALVETVTGKPSLKGQPVTKLLAVLSELNARQPAPQNQHKDGRVPSHKAYIRKLWALWGALSKAGLINAEDKRTALVAFANNRMDRSVQSAGQLDWLTFDEAKPIIDELVAWTKKAGLPKHG